MLDIPFKLSKDQYEVLESLLNTGKFEHEKFSLDLSPVQNISLSNGVMELSPPAKLEATAGPVNIKTTILAKMIIQTRHRTKRPPALVVILMKRRKRMNQTTPRERSPLSWRAFWSTPQKSTAMC